MQDPRTPTPARAPWDADALAPLLAGFSGTALPPWLAAALADGLGGVVLFGHNLRDLPTTRILTAAIAHASSGRALVAIDEEGGDVTRLEARQGSSVPSAAAFGRVDDADLTRRAGRATGDLLHALGIHLDFAPVADVATRPGNPVIGTRSFGESPELVARHALAWAEGLQGAGVLACAKHAPGHGDTAEDSHLALPRVDLDAATMRRDHLAPFAELAGTAAAMMTAHVLVPALGAGPASLSRWSTELLRALGHDGLVVTDALDMAGASGEIGLGEACVRALEAGADLLCLGTALRRDEEDMLREAHDAILGALGSGRLERSRLRGIRERTRARLDAVPDPPGAAAVEDALDRALADLAAVGAEASRRALEVRGPLPAPGPLRLVDARVRRDHAAGDRGTLLADALRSAGAELLPAETVPEGAAEGTTVLLTRLAAADPEEQAVLEAHPGAVVVHTGVAALAPVRPAAILLAHGGGRAMMTLVADVLTTAEEGGAR